MSCDMRAPGDRERPDVGEDDAGIDTDILKLFAQKQNNIICFKSKSS